MRLDRKRNRKFEKRQLSNNSIDRSDNEIKPRWGI